MSRNQLRTYLSHKAGTYFNASAQERRNQTAFLEQIARETINQTYRDLVPSSAGVAEYVSDLFPSAQWVRRYNMHWLMGDVIAGTILAAYAASTYG
jgi:sodium-independent sulfate anion transporter 11